MESSSTTEVALEPAGPAAQAGSKQELPPRLPKEPLFVIEPAGSSAALDLRGLWAYRELLYFLIWRDIKVRYKQAALSVAWVVMQPVLTALIFTVFLGRLAGVPSDGAPYPVFVFAGLLPWTYFSSAVLNGGNSLVGSANLITKVYFPRVIVPLAAVGARLVDMGVSCVILLALMLYYGVAPTWRLVLALPLVALTTLLALGIGMWASALNVKYRDVGVALPVLVQLWMYLSPVVYPSGLVPERWRLVYSLNPLVGLIEGFRASVLGRGVDWRAVAISAAVTAAILVYSSYAFRRMERSFADVI